MTFLFTKGDIRLLWALEGDYMTHTFFLKDTRTYTKRKKEWKMRMLQVAGALTLHALTSKLNKILSNKQE